MSGALAFWKTAHILSAAVLFGTGLGIAFYCWFGYRNAMRAGDIGALRATLRLTVIAATRSIGAFARGSRSAWRLSRRSS